MNIGGLKKLLHDDAAMLDEWKVKKTPDDLRSIAQVFASHGEMSLADYAAMIRQAGEYVSSAKLKLPTKKPKANAVTVPAVQNYLRRGATLAETFGASKHIQDDVTAVAEALTPFQPMAWADLGEFLAVAKDFDPNAAPPEPVKKTRAPAKPKSTKGPPPAEIIENVMALYETIIETTKTREELIQELEPIATLKKPDLQILGERLHIWHSIKKYKVAEIQQKIQDAVRERKFRYERSDY